MDLDIFLRSPKLIVYEPLLGDPLLNPAQADALIIDLGQIEIQTKLIQKEKNKDYTQERDPSRLYDCMLVKFGRMKISVDFGLRFIDHQYIGGPVRWRQSSNLCVNVTNDLNFGCELHTCLTPYHPTLPSQIINVKFEELRLNVNRKVVQTLLRFMAIYFNGSKSNIPYNSL